MGGEISGFRKRFVEFHVWMSYSLVFFLHDPTSIYFKLPSCLNKGHVCMYVCSSVRLAVSSHQLSRSLGVSSFRKPKGLKVPIRLFVFTIDV